MKKSSLIGTDLGRTGQTHVQYRLTKTSIYHQLNSPTAQIRTNQTIVLLNILYHLHELCIYLIEFRFTIIRFR